MKGKINKIGLIIYSTSTEFEGILNFINKGSTDIPFLLLSPTIAFENEKDYLVDNTLSKLTFHSFHDFIDMKEMKEIDNLAYNFTLKDGNKFNNQKKYYETIKILKNKKILKNISLKYEIQNGVVLANDQGITPEVWCSVDNILNGTTVKIKNNFRFKITFYRYKKLYTDKSLQILFYGGERIFNYLDYSKFKLKEPSVLELMIFNIVFKIEKKIPFKFFSNFLFDKNKIENFLVSVHDYSYMVESVVSNTGIKLYILQDSYLPNNYTSKYLKFYSSANKFLTWDNLSNTFFKKNGLICEMSDLFRSNKIYLLNKCDSNEIKNILYVASGSGDWTSQKNRSDEDLAFLNLYKLSKEFPQLNFYFRPHPFWVNHEHQGVNSIKRIELFLEAFKPQNFILSQSINRDAETYKASLSHAESFNSLDDEINNCDVILGDHSQTLISCASKNKIIASMNFSNRDTFFINYTNLGFPLISKYSDLKSFFLDLINNDKKKKIIKSQNMASIEYNRINKFHHN